MKCTTIRWTTKACRFASVSYRSGAGAFRPGRGSHPAASAPHRVLVVLGDSTRDHRNLVLLEAVDHSQIRRGGKVVATLPNLLPGTYR
jgi:hypothetical protein